jgi:hypothetical protein
MASAEAWRDTTRWLFGGAWDSDEGVSRLVAEAIGGSATNADSSVAGGSSSAARRRLLERVVRLELRFRSGLARVNGRVMRRIVLISFTLSTLLREPSRICASRWPSWAHSSGLQWWPSFTRPSTCTSVR